MSLLGKQSGPQLFVRLSKVSALEHVRLRQVLLYYYLKSLLFGALISAVDPVAVLAVFDEVQVNISVMATLFSREHI